MDNRSILDMSVINFGKVKSLETTRQAPTSKFTDIALEVTTKPNGGNVEYDYTNKCCFIAIFDGLMALGISYIRSLEITPLILMIVSDFLELDTMIDTDNVEHKKCLEYLVGQLPDIKLHFFIGKIINNSWTTTPDPSVIIGTGNRIIRILNKGYHFEFITTSTEQFVRTPTKSPEFYVQQQQEEEEKIRIYLQDLQITKQMEIEEEMKLAQQIIDIETDRLFAMTFLTASNIATQI